MELLDVQLSIPDRWDGVVANVGGGRECSLSLRETTALCAEITGHEFDHRAPPPTPAPETSRCYYLDCSRLFELTDWRPRRGAAPDPGRHPRLDLR